ncbi:MAG: hypothetical protein ABH876_00810 [Patescibacteria group bacterium]|nr:hypothetical protein [Patescibacteria group bacterium]MBU1876861.1 hypothetical protein [Patescibacteria group bacterium]
MKIIGHQKQLDFLNQSVRSKKLSHAYLFSGQEKLGKKTIALEWAGLINSQAFQEQNPDFIFITPQDKKIQIFQIRDLIWRLSLKPSALLYKIVIINDAHLMGVDAQHALLKTLEEPKGNSILILVTDHAEALFPTVRSRCETIKFYPVAKNEIVSYLNQQNVSDLETIVSLSRGRPGEAVEFALDPQKLEKRKKITQQLDQIAKSFLHQRFKYAKELSQQENLKETLEIWLDFLRNKLILQIQDSDENNLLTDSNQLKNKLNLLQKLYVLISSGNTNSKLALETLFINL